MKKSGEAHSLRLVVEHIFHVQQYMADIVASVARRAAHHDQSKYRDDEIDLVMGKATLDSLEYRSPEYEAALQRVMPHVSNHYKANSHHPEHYENGINGMSLLDLMEMMCDWKAAGDLTGGNIENSINSNVERFGISPQMESVLNNTAREMGW